MPAAASGRAFALLALALPVLAGLVWMASAGAPPHYLLINALALVAGAVLVLWAAPLFALATSHHRLTSAALLAVLALPLLTGPEYNDITRWLPLPGGLALHAGLLVLPLLVALCAQVREDAPLILPAALLIALWQPDAASAAAIMLAAVGLARAWDDWRLALVAALGFLVTVLASLRGELPAQPFVERVLVNAAFAHPLAGLALLAAQLGGFALIAGAINQPRAVRLALAGSLFGFGAMAIINHYPTPLIGFGASPILGYALALALPERTEP